MSSFNKIDVVQNYCYKILPLVYDDSLSYYEVLCKMKTALNDVIENVNNLPDYIADLIEQFITSGAIDEVIREILANYLLNVKYPPKGITPAVGDGSADDTEAIQGCIDYAFNHGGMAVYFPSGKYLTQPLVLKNKATLFGQDRYSTVLVMKGGATTTMFTGDVDELTLTGLGFDGNMDIQVNNINLFAISVNSAIIANCLLTGGYDLLNITVNEDLQLSDVIFKHAVENALVLKGEGIVQGNNLVFKSVSALVGKNFVVMDVSKSILEQLKCYGASPNAVLINGSNNVVKMWNEQSLKAYTDNGVNNTVEVYTQSEQKKLTGSITTDVSGDLTETIGGNKTETITGEKEVNVNSLTENIANEKHVIAGSVNEDVTNDKTVTAKGISETAVNKMVHITENSTEQIGGNKTTNVEGTNSIIADEIKLNPTEPLFYGTPQTFNDYYDCVPFNSMAGDIYKVLVGKSTAIDVVNIGKIGCVGDGLTDNAEKLQSIINNNVGKIIFIPKGTFLISNTITLPSGSVIMGSGFNSVIKANKNNFDMFKTENFDNLTNTDTHDSAVGNWLLSNFMLDGNYYSNPENETLSGRTTGRGLCIYGNNYYLINMIISNNPDTGLWIENNTYDNPAFNVLRAGEWTIDKCVIKFNGQHGLYSKGVYDFHLTNSTIASNSRKQHGTYDNLRIDGGNLKCTNCHFYSNYGTIKPKYSVNIMANAGSCTFSNCHIEGAMTPLYIGAEHQIIDACVIYASFGEYDCILAAGHNIITNCRFLNQVGDTSLEKPQWKSAIAFANNPRNCYIFAYCTDTPFIDDMTNCGYLNVFHIYGYNNTNIMENKACVIDTAKADYIIRGDFGEQSEYKETTSLNNYTTIGAPDALKYDYFAGINGNVTFNNNLCTIISYTSGTLTIGEWATGRLKILINKTASSIPYNTNGITIDGGTSGNILPNSLLILISNTQNNYTSINLAS